MGDYGSTVIGMKSRVLTQWARLFSVGVISVRLTETTSVYFVFLDTNWRFTEGWRFLAGTRPLCLVMPDVPAHIVLP